jgi:predicted MFS family arabinose efflux permease
VPVSVLLTRSFRKRRGLALGTASAGVGVGISVVVPLTQFLIERIGWRMAYFGLAAIAASVVLPIALFALRERRTPPWHEPSAANPEPPGSEPESLAAGRLAEWTLAAALRSREFWLVSATFMLLNSPIQLILTHHVAHLVEAGQSRILVAGIVGLVGLFSIPAKIGWGYLSDRIWPEWIYLGGSICVIGAILVLLAVDPESSVWSLYPYAALIGVGYAVSPAMTPIMCGIFFSGPHFGVIFGALNTLYHAGGAMGVWLAGYSHDLTGGYRFPFLASILAVTLSAGCVWLAAPRHHRPARPR